MSPSSFLRKLRALTEDRHPSPDSALASACIAPHSLRYAAPLYILCDETRERRVGKADHERLLPLWRALGPLP